MHKVPTDESTYSGSERPRWTATCKYAADCAKIPELKREVANLSNQVKAMKALLLLPEIDEAM